MPSREKNLEAHQVQYRLQHRPRLYLRQVHRIQNLIHRQTQNWCCWLVVSLLTIWWSGNLLLPVLPMKGIDLRGFLIDEGGGNKNFISVKGPDCWLHSKSFLVSLSLLWSSSFFGNGGENGEVAHFQRSGRRMKTKNHCRRASSLGSCPNFCICRKESRHALRDWCETLVFFRSLGMGDQWSFGQEHFAHLHSRATLILQLYCFDSTEIPWYVEKRLLIFERSVVATALEQPWSQMGYIPSRLWCMLQYWTTFYLFIYFISSIYYAVYEHSPRIELLNHAIIVSLQ